MTSESPQAFVIGPTLVDIYFIGKATRLDRNAPVPLIDTTHQLVGAGGAANTAVTLARLGLPTGFVTAIGEGPEQSQIIKCLDEPNLRLCACFIKDYKNPVKTRVFTETHQLVARFDAHTDELKVEDHICDTFGRAAMGNGPEHPKVILISDYGNAVVTEEVLTAVFRYAQEQSIPIVADPAIRRMQLYKNCHIIMTTAAQACEYTRCADYAQAANKLYNELRPKYLFLTLGAEGALLYDNSLHPRHYPALPAVQRSSCGCGDATVAALTYAVATQMPIDDAAKYAVAAGAAEVEVFGAVPVGAHDVFRKMLHYEGSTGKILTRYDAKRIRDSARTAGLRFGVTPGIFDLMHSGHMELLSQARDACDFLLVLLNTDESAEHIKRKPNNSEVLRANMLASLPYVDAVMLFNTSAPFDEVRSLAPDFFFKGSDYTFDNTPCASLVVEKGGKFVTIPRPADGPSTTATLAKMTQQTSGQDDA